MKLKIFLSRFVLASVFLIIIGFCPACITGQDIFNDYAPIKNFSPSPEIIPTYRATILRSANKVEFQNNGAKTDFFEGTKRLSDIIHRLDSMHLLMYSDTLTKFVNQIKDNIVSNNPELQQKEYKIFLLRTPEPNAFYFGEGLILFCLGLIERLQTVDEVATILGHEMSHDYFNHLVIGLHQRSEMMNSKQAKKEIRQAARTRMYRTTAIQNLLNAYQADYLRYKRTYELKADSMGFLFSSRCGYNVIAAKQVLNVLDEADQLRFPNTLPLEQIFSSEQFPFKSYWLYEENLAYLVERDSIVGLTPDSLKTHPDCDVRKESLAKMNLKSQPDIQNNMDAESQYRNLRPQFEFEMLATLIQVGQYPMALYTALNLQKEFPENRYLKYATANALIELGKLASGNKYLESVEFPDDQYQAGYNQVLTFLQNLNSTALNQLADQYLLKNELTLDDHPYGEYLKIISSPDPITPAVVTSYQEKFQESAFSILLGDKVVAEQNKSKK